MKGLIAMGRFGDLDLSFGSVIQSQWFRCMVIGREGSSLHLNVMVLGPAPGIAPEMVRPGPALLIWREIDDYEQVS